MRDLLNIIPYPAVYEVREALIVAAAALIIFCSICAAVFRRTASFIAWNTSFEVYPSRGITDVLLHSGEIAKDHDIMEIVRWNKQQVA